MFERFKKVPNPQIEIIEGNIQKRGLLLVEGRIFRRDIYISDITKFINFAKRSGVGTIFTENDGYFKQYYYLVNGLIVGTSLRLKLKR